MHRKLTEALLAVRLENQFSKQQILDDYLNTIYFGRSAYGIEAAAEAYFAEPAPKLTVGPDALSSLYALTATASTLDPLSVTFAVRRGSGAWQRVAVDDSPPYRAFLEPPKFRRKERVQVVALARSSSGAVTASAVVTAVPRL